MTSRAGLPPRAESGPSSPEPAASGPEAPGRAGTVLEVVPGLVASLLLAAAAALVADRLPGPVGAVPLAIGMGLVLGQVLPRGRIGPGVALVAKRVLRVGIVLLGARLSLGEIAELGAASVGLVLGALVLGFGTAFVVGRALGLPDTMVSLLGAGSSICGNTAIMAAAPVVRARARDVGLAVATITLCGTVSLVAYPVIGRLLGMDATSFGIWAGLAIQDTSQVVAAGAAFSEEARDVATVVKLVRTTALAAILPLLAWWHARRGRSDPGSVQWLRAVPPFVLGFLALAAIRSVGIIGPGLGTRLSEIASWTILLAVAGLGLSVDVRELRRASLRPVVVGAAAALALGAFALVAALLVGQQV